MTHPPCLNVIPSADMVDFFMSRTSAHISTVGNFIDLISTSALFPGLDLEELQRRKAGHDNSKFSSPEERIPYIWLTEFHRRKSSNLPFRYPPGVESQVQDAISHHIHTNRHHVQFHDSPSNMSKEDMVEMVADFAAISVEMKTSLLQYIHHKLEVEKVGFEPWQREFILRCANVILAASTQPGRTGSE